VGVEARIRKEITEARMRAGRFGSASALLDLRLYSDGDLVLEGQIIYPSPDGGIDDSEFFTSVGRKDLPRLIVALVVDYFNTVDKMNPIWESADMRARRGPDRTVQCVPTWRNVEFRVGRKLWGIPTARRETRRLAFEMVREAFERGHFGDDADFREWMGERSIPWEFYSY
jgi:hypothetical protein